jgi:hypothetical protein
MSLENGSIGEWTPTVIACNQELLKHNKEKVRIN